MQRVRARRAGVTHKSRADGVNGKILNKQDMKFSAIMRGFISLFVRFCLCAAKFTASWIVKITRTKRKQ